MTAKKYFTEQEKKAARNQQSRNWNKDNPNKHREQSAAHYHGHRESIRERRRDLRYQRIYGITLEEYNKMFAAQNGCCYICKTHQADLGKPLSVDHHHSSGKVRRLLCVKCNAGLGNFKEDASLLRKAMDYLKEFNQ